MPPAYAISGKASFRAPNAIKIVDWISKTKRFIKNYSLKYPWSTKINGLNEKSYATLEHNNNRSLKYAIALQVPNQLSTSIQCPRISLRHQDSDWISIFFPRIFSMIGGNTFISR